MVSDRMPSALLVVMLATLAGGCPRVPPETQTPAAAGAGIVDEPGLAPSGAGPPREAPAAPASFPEGTPADVQRYLRTIHQRLRPRWDQVRADADRFPDDHAVNDPSLVAVVELRLDPDGQPVTPRLARSSGVSAFDNSAMRVMAWLRELPALPASAGHGRAVLRWSFHRDARAAAPQLARLTVEPLAPAEALTRAIARKQWQRAGELVRRHGADREVLAVVAEAALATSDLHLHSLAVELASPRQLVALATNTPSTDTFGLVLDRLEALGETASMTELLGRLAPRGDWRGPARITPRAVKRIDALVQRMERLSVKVPDRVLLRLLLHRYHAVCMAVLPLVRSQDLLKQVARKRRNDTHLINTMAVRMLALGSAPRAARAVRWALNDPDEQWHVLEALERFQVPQLAGDVGALIAGHKADVQVKVKACAVLGTMQSSPRPLYRALAARDARVQIAAAAALARFDDQQRAIAYRLAELARRSRGRVRAAALAGLARMGLEQHRAQVLRQMKRLKPADRSLVVRQLWGYGEGVVARLANIAAGKDARLREAATAALERIPGLAARDALRLLRGGAATVPPPAAGGKDPSPLRTLMEQALAIRRGG